MQDSEITMGYLIEELAMGRLPQTVESITIEDPDGSFLAAMDMLKAAGREGDENL